MTPTVSLIVAYSRNRVIGKDNQLPWRLPGDLAHFKRQTMGKPIIMGRKTWLSLGRPLPGRTNIVVSRSGQGDFTGAVLVDSLQAALTVARVAAANAGTNVSDDAQEICIIGGAQLYANALPMVNKIIATEIDTEIEGDAFFPELDPSVWVQADRQHQPPENGLAYDFVEYRRRA